MIRAMNRSLTLSAIAVAALALSSCSSTESADQPEPVTSPTEETADNDGNLGFTKLELGDTFTFTGDDDYPADVTLRVDTLNASRACHNGTASYSDTKEDPNSTYVLVAGEMDVKSNAWNDSFYISPNEWVAVDKDGYRLSVTPAHICETEPISTWSNPLDSGQKRKTVEEFEVKGVPVQWGVKPLRSKEGWGWEVNTISEAESTAAPQPTAPVEQPDAAPAPSAGSTGYTPEIGPNGYPLDPNVPGANQPYPGELTYDEQRAIDSGLSNAELGNLGYSASTPNDCDGYLGAHEDADDSHC